MSRRITLIALGLATAGVFFSVIVGLWPKDNGQRNQRLGHALVKPGTNNVYTTWSNHEPMAAGSIVDINLGQMASYAGVSVTLESLGINSRNPHLRSVGSFFANLCGRPADPFGILVDTEKPKLGIRTYFPNSRSTRARTVETQSQYIREYESRHRSGIGCHFWPDWIWVLRITATSPGRYRWDGLIATYKVDGQTYNELLPQNAYNLTWK